MLRYKEIKQSLLYEIARLKPDDRLASRPVLCKRLDTTRTTLDKAIRELENEGYLYSRNGSGTYVASLDAAGSASGNSWGMIVPNVMDAIYPGLVRGTENVAQRNGINIILCNSDNDPDKQELYIRRLIQTGVSGIIIVPIVSNDIRENFRLYNQLANSKMPFVFCNRSVEGIDIPVVTSNDFYGGYIATKHLIAHGYRKIAYIAKMKYKTSIDRFQGYLSALIESGLEVNRRHIAFGLSDGESLDGYAEMMELLSLEERPDSVFCFNDRVARGAYEAIAQRGLAVSDDIGIIGYDDTDVCRMLKPSLTSVSYKNVEVGEKAASLLLDIIERRHSPGFDYYLFQPTITERESCLKPERAPGTRDGCQKPIKERKDLDI